jgi:hypothetical protein
MEILAFSDLHGNRELIDVFVNSVIAKRLNPDIFVCAGLGDPGPNRISSLRL